MWVDDHISAVKCRLRTFMRVCVKQRYMEAKIKGRKKTRGPKRTRKRVEDRKLDIS